MTMSAYANRTRVEQLDHVRSVLDPCFASKYQHLDYAIDVAVRYEWNLKLVSDWKDATGCFSTRTIETPSIYSDVDLAVFMHEGGHVETPVAWADRESMESELAAWRWAMKTLGRRWNTVIQHTMVDCLRTYQSWRVKTYQDLLTMEAVFAEGHELTRHIVRMIR